MSNNYDDKHYGIKAIEEFSNGISKDREIIADLNTGAASRLVWFVAISGFAFLNVRSFADAVAGYPIAGYQLIVLSLPWALTASLGVIAHWAIGNLIAKDDIYYILKQHSIRSFLATAEKAPTIPDVLTILNVDETEEDVAKSKSELDRFKPFVDRLERSTFISLLLAVAWSIVYPCLLIK